MGRIPDHLVSLAFRALENRWVTIGAKVGKNTNGKKKGGTPVELDGEGKITKGPAALTGKRPSELSQSHLFTGQDHKSQRKLFAEPGDPPPPPPIEETPKAPPAPAKKEPKPRAKKPLSMSLLAVIRREGGISSGDFEHADFKEFGLLGALNKKGLSLDDMAATMVRQGHITVPMGKSSPSDHLLQLLKKKTNSLLAADTAEYDKDYEAYMQARKEAHADGYPEEQLAEASGRGEEAGDQESANRIFEEIFGGNGGGGEEAGRDEEPGDLAGDASEPASGLDTSFDFGPAAAPKVEEKPKAAKPKKAAKQDKPAQAPAPPAIEPQAPPPPPPPATNLFGQPEPTKPQPATTQGLFGEQVPVEDPKLKPRETVADQAEKGLDWLYQKQDPKTDGTGEMFGGLFSPGRTSGATEPEAGPVAPPAVSERQSAEPATKPTHEMTKAEFQKAYMDKANELLTKAKGRKMKDVMGVAGKAIAELGGDHFEQIKKARAAGKAIPQEVLADYPYLKEPHEMSQQEWAAKWLASSPGRAPRDIDMDLVKLLRKADVKRAIDAGKQVPASVLRDYPELKPGTENYEPLDDREDPSKSSFWLNQKTQLEKTKPRPLNKLYGPNPTPEQVAYHQELMKTWNSKNRNAEKKRRELREIEDAAYRKKMTTESRTLSTIRQQLREAFRQCP
jgi:hypothetical protein